MSVSVGVIQLPAHPFNFFWPCLVLFCSKDSSACSPQFYYSVCVCDFVVGAKEYKERIPVAYIWTLSLFPPPSVIYSFSLSPLFPRGFPNHTTTPLTDAALTDLLPSSFHWPPVWQPRFNAAFSLAKTWQVNLWVYCDLMPPAFEVSYSSVAYRTQKRCQVAIVKSYPWRRWRWSIIVLTSWEEKTPSCEHREMCSQCEVSMWWMF